MMIDDIEGLAAAYAVDAVDDVERLLFETHLTGCRQCQSEVDSLRGAATELTLQTETAPPPWMRTSVLLDISAVRALPPQVTAESAPEPRVAPLASPPLPAPAALDSQRDKRARRAHPRGRWLTGLAAAAVLATGGLTWHPWQGRSEVQQTAMVQVLHANDLQRFEMKNGQATATVLRSAALNKALITTANLPAAPPGKVYEVWLQQGLVMVKAGLITGGPPTTVLLQGNPATAAAADITIEPLGGSPHPTTLPLAQISFT